MAHGNETANRIAVLVRDCRRIAGDGVLGREDRELAEQLARDVMVARPQIERAEKLRDAYRVTVWS
jgi:hypothetical protein